MTIPLDNLYDYIFSLTGHNNKNLRMYRFSPHGAKNIKNLITHNNVDTVYISLSNGRQRSSWHYKLLFCYDQEPLNFDLYKNNIEEIKETFSEKKELSSVADSISKKILCKKNISSHRMVTKTVYDKKLLLHSEKNSEDLKKYEKNGFLGVYYWSHAFISLDWYRYAKHDSELNYFLNRTYKRDFNVYCRAWTGTREYRLKFLELLKKNEIDNLSLIYFNEFSDENHYSEYIPKNKDWTFQKNNIDNLNNITFRDIDSSASAIYESNDYKNSAIDVVLETVFDKKKIQLTEKILRPIACGKPFILVSEKNSLEHLKSYGFKTFGNLIDESYDYIDNPKDRLSSIIKTMKTISSFNNQEKNNLFLEMHKIAEYNKNWFFSKNFFNLINSELKNNLSDAIQLLDNPEYQTAKEPRLIYRAYRRYKKYLSGDSRKLADDIINEYPDVIRLSKKNIGKY
jgi:hypothetical protein